MRFTTKTEYALVCLAYMAKQVSNKIVTVAELVKHEKMSETYIQKIFLSLRQANIVVAHPGRNGGYSLARSPQEIALKQVIEALEGHTFDVFCEPRTRDHIVCTHFCMCGIRPVWAKTKELLDDFYSSITLDMIAKEEKEALNSISERKGASF